MISTLCPGSGLRNLADKASTWKLIEPGAAHQDTCFWIATDLIFQVHQIYSSKFGCNTMQQNPSVTWNMQNSRNIFEIKKTVLPSTTRRVPLISSLGQTCGNSGLFEICWRLPPSPILIASASWPIMWWKQHVWACHGCYSCRFTTRAVLL